VRLLLDTHTLIWCVDDASKVSGQAMAAMIDPNNTRLLSAATIWELAIKVGQGKITLSTPFQQCHSRPKTDHPSRDGCIRSDSIQPAWVPQRSLRPPDHFPSACRRAVGG
jgi:PIN domain nuclease of toxin-antitoxin system